MVICYVYDDVQPCIALSFGGFIVNEFSSASCIPKTDGFEFFSGLVYFHNFVKQCHLVDKLVLMSKLCCNIFKCTLIL